MIILTIYDDLYFVYDGISSYSMGVIHVTVGKSGMLQETFAPTTKINEVSVRGRNRPYFIDTERDPLVIPMQITFNVDFSEERLEEIANWLIQPFYKELYFSNNPSKRYYTVFNGNSQLIHNGIRQGYIELEMRNIDSYRYSPIISTPYYYEYENNSNGTEFVIDNDGSEPIFPSLDIEKTGDGDIRIINLSNGSQEFKLSGLVNGEMLEIDMEDKSIETNLTGIYRYKNHNDIFLELPRGKNYLMVYGNCKLRWTYQFKYLS
ncbi:distal tail protein Dit [Paenibacillus sp. NAIST15-1]|uniref:distal tail protein Dit n=1 Tax=Paenibacillus sp. NAIST15-1 TaxID=1605994 RepID=UPI001D0F5BF3|nr:distal tail protein Dit [Paenibacillus sp. NAIST15-1]